MKLIETHALTVAIANLYNKKVPGRTALTIAQNYKVLLPHAEDYLTRRMAIIEDHADIDTDGKPVVVDGNYKIDDMAGYEAALTAMGDIQVDVVLKTVPADDLGDLTAGEASALGELLV